MVKKPSTHKKAIYAIKALFAAMIDTIIIYCGFIQRLNGMHYIVSAGERMSPQTASAAGTN